ncbi:MAG: dTMP kinase [Chitinophagaceae bacterium]|nr:dTMP kinase [Oligoflexus sp.]
MPQFSRFISIEGGEGVGKSYLSHGLQTRLQQLQYEVLLTREPGGTPLADSVRQIFLNPPEKPTALAELFLVSAARTQHVQKLIRPALDLGRWVICDRFYDSTRVYQGDLAGVDSKVLESVIAMSVEGCHPAQTFVLDCPTDIAMDRVQKRTKQLQLEATNRYDEGSREMYESLRKGYLKRVAEFPERIVRLDASQTPEQVLDDAWAHVKQCFKL